MAVLPDELLAVPPDELLEDAELDVEGTLLVVLLEDSVVIELKLEMAPRGTVEISRGTVDIPLLVLLEITDVVKALEVRLVTVFESMFDVVLEEFPRLEMLDTAVGVSTETVTKAYNYPCQS